MLELLGFGDDEEQVYLALLELGTAEVDELLTYINSEHRSSVLEIDKPLLSLERRGLIEQLPGSPHRYRLFDPALALSDFVTAREHELQRTRLVLESLSLQHRQHQGEVRPESLIEVVDDSATAAQLVLDTYSHAEHEVLAMERPPYGEPNTEPNPIELELLAKGVRHRVLYEQSAVEQPGRLADLVGGMTAGEEARVTPTLPGRLLMVDHRRALLPAQDGGLLTELLLVVHPGVLLDMIGALFELTWLRSIPLDMLPGPSVAAHEAMGSDEVILSLMASGLTDQAMARHLDISERTVQRRIQKICERLGAGTRFQAGLQAARERLL